MKKKSFSKEKKSLDKIIEAISDRKNAWKKILLELENGKKTIKRDGEDTEPDSG